MLPKNMALSPDMSSQSSITLYIGGTRSGKSAHAERSILTHAKGSVLYVATAESRANDPAMQARIKQHSQRRPANWDTLECPRHLAQYIAPYLTAPCLEQHKAEHCPSILLDCVTMWISNIIFSLPNPEDTQKLEDAVRNEITPLLTLAQNSACRWVIVSGETGLGGIAPSPLERAYHDALGLANQLIATVAHDAFLVVAGRTLRLDNMCS